MSLLTTSWLTRRLNWSSTTGSSYPIRRHVGTQRGPTSSPTDWKRRDAPAWTCYTEINKKFSHCWDRYFKRHKCYWVRAVMVCLLSFIMAAVYVFCIVMSSSLQLKEPLSHFKSLFFNKKNLQNIKMKICSFWTWCFSCYTWPWRIQFFVYISRFYSV